MENLWNKDIEKKFFNELVEFATPEQLFYATPFSEFFWQNSCMDSINSEKKRYIYDYYIFKKYAVKIENPLK